MKLPKTRLGNIRVVYRHGQPIKVRSLEYVGLPPAPTRSERQKHLFARMTHEEAIAGFTAMRCPMALVWYALIFRTWAERSNTVRVPTALLRLWGVNRNTWRRGINNLERAGLIRTQRDRGKVTICRLVRPSTRNR